MANLHHFTGRVAASVSLTTSGDRKIAKFTLIRNEYAGSDKDGNRKERKVAIQFTAFDGRAEFLAEHLRKGDQLEVGASISNNDYKKGDEMVYGYNWTIQTFEFGAPGPESRERMAKRGSNTKPATEGPAAGFEDDEIPF
jgi:single-strand DNA-binding protein